MLDYQKAEKSGKIVKGMIPVLDVQYGNVWTNIPKELFDLLGIGIGEKVHMSIFYQSKLVYETVAPYHNTFGEVPEGQPLIYINSLLNVSVAINMGSFASIYKVQSGPSWTVEISKAE
jgi:S-adenosylmethionine hydrolase